MEEVAGEDRLGLVGQERPQVCPARPGAGSIPASLRIFHTVDGAILYPRPVPVPPRRVVPRHIQHQRGLGLLSPVLDLAAKTGVDLEIRDTAGHTVASSPGFAAGTAPASSAPIEVRGQQLGTALVRFTGSGLGAADNVLRRALLHAITGAAGLAALLALAAGLAVARRITRPVARLIAVTRSMADGDRASRAGDVRALGELQDLAAAFDHMADTLDREDQIRRDLVASVAHELRTPIAVLQRATRPCWTG